MPLPAAAVELIGQTLSQLARGKAVTIIPIHAEMTTQQAADFLGVSRPHLVKLLEQGAIAFRKVGAHRRVRVEDLLAFKRNEDARRQKALDELSAESQRLGLYGELRMSFTALFDSCVLHPALLRDLLLQLATTGIFRARWSASIHEEWMASVPERLRTLRVRN